MKKRVLWWMYVIIAVVFECTVVFAAMVAVEYYNDPAGMWDFVYVMLALGGMSILQLYIVNRMNQVYDSLEEFKGKKIKLGRWDANLLFLGLVGIYTVILAGVDAGNDDSAVIVVKGISVAAVVWMCDLYICTYHSRQNRTQRVHGLINQNVMHRHRRYTLTAKSFQKNEQGRVIVEGVMHGSAKVGDKVLVSHPDSGEESAKIIGLEADGEKKKYITDAKVKVTLQGLNEQPHDFSVVTDIKPYTSRPSLKDNNAENPYLVGLLHDYTELYRDGQYLNLLTYAICHAHYIVCGTVQNDKKVGDIMDILPVFTDIGFASVSQRETKEQMFPIFTDWQALQGWKQMMSAEKSVTLMMDFPQLIGIVKNGYTGIVINPFGPRPFALSRDFIQSILASPGYQHDFNHQKGENNEK